LSKVKIQGNASGTGVVTLTAPNTNTDRTITLPDSSDTLVSTAPSTSGNVLTSDGTNWTSAAPAAGGGITDIEQWRITSSATGNYPNGLTANWARLAYNHTTYGFFSGSGMSESSGVFTFPSTGYWRVTFVPQIYGLVNDRLIYVRGETSVDGGTSWSNGGSAVTSSDAATVHSSTHTGLSATWDRILDITDVSNHKIKFCVEFNFGGSTNIVGNTTSVVFERLGDT